MHHVHAKCPQNRENDKSITPVNDSSQDYYATDYVTVTTLLSLFITIIISKMVMHHICYFPPADVGRRQYSIGQFLLHDVWPIVSVVIISRIICCCHVILLLPSLIRCQLMLDRHARPPSWGSRIPLNRVSHCFRCGRRSTKIWMNWIIFYQQVIALHQFSRIFQFIGCI